MKLSHIIAQETGISLFQISAVISLLDEGNTIPFVARYRKEATGGLDEVELRAVQKQLLLQRSLQDRRGTILGTIEQQGKLTSRLREQIESARSRTALEDLYQPYKPRRRTRAQSARELGLAPLADHLLAQKTHTEPPDAIARRYLSEKVPTVAAAWDGAVDIAAEIISDHPGVRQAVRQRAERRGLLRCKKKANAIDERGVYRTYHDFEFRIDRLRPHQVLAINRGEREKILSVSIEIAEHDWKPAVDRSFPARQDSSLAELLDRTKQEAASRLLLPAIERGLRRRLSEKAGEHAIRVFAENLEALLSQPPVPGIVLGIDPGFRTGSKWAVVDGTGRLLDTGTIYPHPPQRQLEEAKTTLARAIDRWKVSLLAIGNGTASRETEQLVAEVIKAYDRVHYVIVSEAGASVYSASQLAAKEFPDLDVSIRGAVSIARRLQDPLAELVKIDPRSIGVGLYQHDVDQKDLKQSLQDVVESVVNRVGVDLNTASSPLLAYVAGIGPQLAEKIVAYRDGHGPFSSRGMLRDVRGLGAKAFQQSAGFLRVYGGSEALDEGAIHPESYPIASSLLERAGLSVREKADDFEAVLKAFVDSIGVPGLAKQMNVGEATLNDIYEQILRPGIDPRTEAPLPILRRDILTLEDLSKGIVLNGTVRNVVDFGAFIDIGVKQDGLLHRSQWPGGERYRVGQVLEVEILDIDVERQRIALGHPRGET